MFNIIVSGHTKPSSRHEENSSVSSPKNKQTAPNKSKHYYLICLPTLCRAYVFIQNEKTRHNQSNTTNLIQPITDACSVPSCPSRLTEQPSLDLCYQSVSPTTIAFNANTPPALKKKPAVLHRPPRLRSSVGLNKQLQKSEAKSGNTTYSTVLFIALRRATDSDQNARWAQKNTYPHISISHTQF